MEVVCGGRSGSWITSGARVLGDTSEPFLCPRSRLGTWRSSTSFLPTFPATPFVTFQLIRKGNALTTILPLRYTHNYDYEISCCHFCNRTCHRLRCARSITHRERVARVAFTG